MVDKESINKSLRIGVSVFLSVYILQVVFNMNSFYAGIAGVSCLQGDIKNSLKTGIHRCIGTVLGGIFGLLFIHYKGNRIETIYDGIFIALAVGIIILLCSLINISASSSIACIVFLAISTDIMEGKDPYYWAIKRIVATICGVIICLSVNYLLNGEYKDVKHIDRVRKYITKNGKR